MSCFSLRNQYDNRDQMPSPFIFYPVKPLADQISCKGIVLKDGRLAGRDHAMDRMAVQKQYEEWRSHPVLL